MPHSRLQLQGGVIETDTPVINTAGVAVSNRIRFKYDPLGLSLPEKLGGWSKFYNNQVTNGPIRALWAWEDTNAGQWLGYGTANTAAAQLEAIECFVNPGSGLTHADTTGNFTFDITPTYLSDSVHANFATVSGSATVTVTDPIITGLSNTDNVYIATPVAVGGLVLSGLYAVTPTSADTYTINATDVLGNPAPAAFTTVASPIAATGGSYTSGPPHTITLTWSTPSYAFPPGSAISVNGLSVTEANGTFIVSASSTTSVTFVTTLGSFTYGSGGSISNYGMTPLFSVSSSGGNLITVTLPSHNLAVGNDFYVLNPTWIGGIQIYGTYPVSTVLNTYQFTINGSNAATVSAENFQNSTSVIGGSSSGSAVTLELDEVRYGLPVIPVTGGSGSGTNVTLTWSNPNFLFTAGKTIVVQGINPSAWNGVYNVVSSTTGSVTYANASVATYVSGGTVQSSIFDIGADIVVSGVDPTGWNGYYVVTDVGASPLSVTYANASAAATWVNGGSVSDNGGDVAMAYSLALKPAVIGSGYGVGGYGVGGYGSGLDETNIVGVKIAATNWSLDNWGNFLLALPQNTFPITYDTVGLPLQPIYYWDPTAGQLTAQAIVNGPPTSNGMFVAMPQRQIIAWGSSFSGVIDPLLIRWCDVNNLNTWVAQVTNQAGSFRLPSGAAIIGGRQLPQQGLIWTDIELWSMQYISQPYVYSFNKIGQGCGLIGKYAHGVLGGVTYWMSKTQFFMLSGSGVLSIPCPIWDVVFQDLDLLNADKIVCAANSMFQEISWYFPVPSGDGENSHYIKLNVGGLAAGQPPLWDYGVLDRSAWIDVSVLQQPIGFSPLNHLIYQHEISPDADGAAMGESFTTGWFALAEGDVMPFVDQIWPDMHWGYYGQAQNANMTFTLSGQDYPGQSAQTIGPYTISQAATYISPRMRHRMLSFTVSGTGTGTWWRLGGIRYRFQPDGKY